MRSKKVIKQEETSDQSHFSTGPQDLSRCEGLATLHGLVVVMLEGFQGIVGGQGGNGRVWPRARVWRGEEIRTRFC